MRTESRLKPNRLINEKSPYLLQHAYNPVDWYAWAEEAFKKAKDENKLVFLSIGYSTCHWCHVMEKESFNDPETAQALNETFVSIKVDREERPDLDHIYMTVCHMMTGGGGWPLNVIMTPDRKPFFAGTYFPKESRFGRIGLLELSERIKDLWENRRSDILKSADQVLIALRGLPETAPGEAIGTETLENAFGQLLARFDQERGGFGAAPKFPTPHNMLFLLRYWKRTGDQRALEMVEKTLQAMRLGGIYDHIGFGFHRYSTDQEWLVPHFEKMLYDQALLAIAYIEAYQATGKTEYAQTAEEIFAYVLRDMVAPEGGFYSAEDADTEGIEGKFYLWEKEELKDLLGNEEAEFVGSVLNFLSQGNFHEEASGRLTGWNIPHLTKPLPEIARDFGIPLEEMLDRFGRAREKMFVARNTRIHPHKDDKILTDWNGLMIVALSKGAQVFGNSRFLQAARKAADFILGTMRDSNGRLLHRFRENEAGITATVDDYAFLIWGLIELYEACFEVRYLKAALNLNADLIERFWDKKHGGFYFAADDVFDLPVRKKELYDGATPSGNSVGALNLLRLARITADSNLEQKAHELISTFSGAIADYPSAYTQILCALEFALGPTFEVIISGSQKSEDTKNMLQALRRSFLPNKVVLFRPHDHEASEIFELADYSREHHSISGKATAYICSNYSCKEPTTEPRRMLEMLGV